MKQLHEDPDRLRKPLARRGTAPDGAPIFEEVEWDEAWQIVDEKLTAVRSAHGNESIGVYLGNPNVHLLGSGTHTRPFLHALGGAVRFTASTVDQMPRHVASGYLYGSGAAMPVPDVDRTKLLVLIGTNPFVSNGSICTAPGFPNRIKRVRERGGRVIVIDPAYTRTVKAADLHLRIRPGTDAVLLAAIVHHLIATDRVTVGLTGALVDGLDQLAEAVEPFSPEYAESITGIAAAQIMSLAEEIADAESAAVHGRIGTTTVEFGTLTSWLIDVIAIVTGNLDRPGGSMFPKAAIERVRPERQGREYRVGRWTSRVSGHPEVQGELPASDMPDEILEPGDGQLKAMFTVAGNPVLSCPDGERMDQALESLEAMISVDIYVNETTRHADVILPPVGALEKSHYDVAFYGLSVRNVANWSPPVFEAEGPGEDDILAKIALIALGMGPECDVEIAHGQVLSELLGAEVAAVGSVVKGRDVDELLAMVDGDAGCDRVLDVLLRTGPYGDGFGVDPDGLSLMKLKANPHGIDLGALMPRLPELLSSPNGRIDLFAGPFEEELERLGAVMTEQAADGRLRLIGRRHLRSNNSWMHNVEVLVKGKTRCTLQVNPDDASRLQLIDGTDAVVRSRVGEVIAPVEITDAMMTGVVSLPHGWGHDLPGVRLEIARKHSGVNSNVLTDPTAIDPLSGTSVLNAIAVEVAPA